MKGESAFPTTLLNALFSTALLADWIFESCSEHAEQIASIRSQLEPDPGDLRGWVPGMKNAKLASCR